MDNAKFQKLDKIRLWILVSLAVVFLTAMVLLYFTPVPISERPPMRPSNVSKVVAGIDNTAVLDQGSPGVTEPAQQHLANSRESTQPDAPVAESTDSVVQQNSDDRLSGFLSVSPGTVAGTEMDFEATEMLETGQVPSAEYANPIKRQNNGNSSVPRSKTGNIAKSPDLYGNEEIAGQVLDTIGNAVSGVIVELRAQVAGKTIAHRKFLIQTESDSEGKFKFSNLAEGDYQLTIQATNTFGQVTRLIRAGFSNLNLVLPSKEKIVIQGYVRDIHGQAIPGVSVSIAGKSKSRTDSDGYYQIRNRFLMNSLQNLVFTSNGYRETNESIQISTNTLTVDKQLEFKSQLELTGRVMDIYGKPISSVLVRLSSESTQIRRNTRTDDNGDFSIEDLKQGSDYRIIANIPGYEKFSKNRLTITPSSGPMRIELKPVSKGMLAGVIVNSAGYIVPNYAINISNKSISASSVTVTSDDNGEFNSTPVHEGSLRVTSVSEPRTQITGIEMEAGQDLYLRLVVDQGNFEIYGSVVDDEKRGIANAKITLTWTDTTDALRSDSYRILYTNAQGEYRIKNLGTGLRKLVVAAQGYQNAILNITSDQQTSPLIITLYQ